MLSKREIIEVSSSDDEVKEGPNLPFIEISSNDSNDEQNSSEIIFSAPNPSTQTFKTFTKQKSKANIKIVCWNINGIGRITKIGKLQNLFHRLKPDILCLNELKMTEENIHDSGFIKWIPPEYFYYINCPKKGAYFGVGVISKLKPIKVTYGMNNPKLDNEARVITLEFETFFLVCCYVPCTIRSKDRFLYRLIWDNEFRDYIQNLKSIKSAIICGDMNVTHQDLDVWHPKYPLDENSVSWDERGNFTKLLSEGFLDAFRYKHKEKQKFSFFSETPSTTRMKKGMRIDYFLVDKRLEEKIIDSDVLEEEKGSDHCPIELIYKLS